jgi:hypothetical protein
MTINTRKKQNSKNNYTRKIHKGGNKKLNEDDKKMIEETMQAIDDIKQKELSLDIIDYYSKMPKPMQANKYVIIGSMKRISEQLEIREENKEIDIKELKRIRMEKYIRLYKLIPKSLKRDSDIVQLLLYYEPKLIASNIFPKSLKRKEYFWKTALVQDPQLFYYLDKNMQRKILKTNPEILLKSTNETNINIKGGISIDKLPDLATRGDALGIILSAILGPQIATAFGPALLQLGTPITATLQPIILGIVSLLADAGLALNKPIIAAGAALNSAAASLAPLAALI